MNEQKEVYFDNPIEPAKLPKEKLSFAFVARSETGNPYPEILQQCFWLGAVSLGVQFFAPNIRGGMGGAVEYLDQAAHLLGVALAAGWALFREKTVETMSPKVGLTLAVSVLFLELLSPGLPSLFKIITPLFLIYASAELIIHWAVLKERGINPIIGQQVESRKNPEHPLGYNELIALPIVTMVMFFAADSSSWRSLLVPLVPLVVWIAAWDKCRSRNISPLSLLHFAIQRAYFYPDASKTLPGLVRTPMLPRSLRGVPTQILLVNCVATYFRTGDLISPIAILLVMFGIWSYIAAELCYEF